MITLEVEARKLKAAFLRAGYSERGWHKFFGLLKRYGWIMNVRRNGRKEASLWLLQPICPLHPQYKGKREPRSRKPGCYCRTVWEANTLH